MHVTPPQALILQLAVSASASLSIIACLCVLLLPLIAQGPVEQLHFWHVFILAAINLLEAATYVIGRAAFDDSDAVAHSNTTSVTTSGACKAQGALMQFSSIAGFLWILFFCLLLVRSTLRAGQNSLSAPVTTARLLPPLLAVGSLAALSCVILGALDA
eukprot:698404-Prymnesium_polylepis.2